MGAIRNFIEQDGEETYSFRLKPRALAYQVTSYLPGTKITPYCKHCWLVVPKKYGLAKIERVIMQSLVDIQDCPTDLDSDYQMKNK